MNFDSYNDCGVALSVALVNTDARSSGELLPDVEALHALLTRLEVSAVGPLDDRVLADVRLLRGRLRAIFEAPSDVEAARRINALLVESAALPQLTNHDGDPWHLHYTPPGCPLPERLAAEAAMGLAGVLRAGGFERMRTCADPTCGDVFVDASRNRSRRYCDPDTCGNRANVAAHRARRRAAI
jgi:predicted RNA-binding Zn ribbon-like protein